MFLPLPAPLSHVLGKMRGFFPPCFTFVELLVGGEAGVLLLAGSLGFVVVEFVAAIAGLVGEDDTCGERDRGRRT